VNVLPFSKRQPFGSIGVIDSSTLEISKGLTVLSGETGAGKTMDFYRVTNLDFQEGKADSALVRKGAERLSS